LRKEVAKDEGSGPIREKEYVKKSESREPHGSKAQDSTSITMTAVIT
jgi:hypothetical protein